MDDKKDVAGPFAKLHQLRNYDHTQSTFFPPLASLVGCSERLVS